MTPKKGMGDFVINEGRIQAPAAHITIYTELDALMDTRLGYLLSEHPDIAKSLNFAEYSRREIDDFPNGSAEQFRRIWKNRKDNVLEFAPMTPAVNVVYGMLEGAKNDSIEQPFTSRPVLEVNVYPYSFTEEERLSLEKTLIFKFGMVSGVKVVNIPYKDMNIEYVKAHYYSLVMYNFNDWFSQHHHEFGDKLRIPFITFFVPKLYYDKVPTSSEMMVGGKKVDHAAETRKGLLPLMDLNYLDVRYFSALVPETDAAVREAYSSNAS